MASQPWGERGHCRICGDDRLVRFLDLGSTPLADNFLSDEELRQPETWYPLNMVLCRTCSLVQLGYVVPPEKMYHDNYPYVTSVTAAGRRHFETMGRDLYRTFDLTPKDLVVEIGSNIGVLLGGFLKAGSRKVLGIEPVGPIARMANRRGVRTWNAFFDSDTANRILERYGQAKIIVGTNVIAHIDDHHMLARSIRRLLRKDGVFVFEAPWWLDLLSRLEYDTIYHEHLSYLGVKPVRHLCRMFGLELFDVRWQPIHGGTLRYFIAPEGTRPVSPSVETFLGREARENIYDPRRLRRFAEDVREHRRKLTRLLFRLKTQGKRIAAVSAPAKGMTLLNYCGIGPAILDFVTERSPLKIGLYTPGGHIPVVPDRRLLDDRPDYALLLAWNFADAIMANLRPYADRGGRFIIPIPEPRIVRGPSA